MSDDISEFFEAVKQGRDGGELIPNRGHQPTAVGEHSNWAQTLAAASCWAQSGNSFFPVNDVVKSVPSGAYRCQVSDRGPYLEKMKINIDSLLSLPDSSTEVLLKEFNQFWGLQDSFKKRGFTFKRGMLMWGPPGSGKTSAVWQMTKRIVEDQDGIVVFVENPQVAIWCLTLLRRIEPVRPIITVMEDIDTIIAQYGEHALLALLDGEFQIDNVVHVATTNYPQLLDKRFIDRPSRFDTIMKVGMPSGLARRMYFRSKEPELSEETVERWVRRSDGYSVAHLREICIAINCFNQSEDAVFERLDKMRQVIRLNDSGEDEAGPAGFLGSFVRKAS